MASHTTDEGRAHNAADAKAAIGMGGTLLPTPGLNHNAYTSFCRMLAWC